MVDFLISHNDFLFLLCGSVIKNGWSCWVVQSLQMVDIYTPMANFLLLHSGAVIKNGLFFIQHG